MKTPSAKYAIIVTEVIKSERQFTADISSFIGNFANNNKDRAKTTINIVIKTVT